MVYEEIEKGNRNTKLDCPWRLAQQGTNANEDQVTYRKYNGNLD